MALFITYARYSQDGIRGLMKKPEDRTAVLQKLLDKVGAKVVAIYMTTGEHDIVMVSEAADGGDAVALGMAVAATGSIQDAHTVRAWTSADFVDVVKKAGTLTGAYTPPGS
jgi:uncharacterized protein with GYD domain